jgi:hypothetical protein
MLLRIVPPEHGCLILKGMTSCTRVSLGAGAIVRPNVGLVFVSGWCTVTANTKAKLWIEVK